MARVPPGDSGNWNRNSAAEPTLSIQERINRSVSLVSPEQVQVMKDEEHFLRGAPSGWPMKRFTDRRPPPGRTKLIP